MRSIISGDIRNGRIGGDGKAPSWRMLAWGHGDIDLHAIAEVT